MYLHMSQMHSFSVYLGKESICLNRATVHCLNVLIGFIGDISMCNTLFFTITFIRLMFFFSSFGCTSMVLLTQFLYCNFLGGVLFQ
jgi:hypothetical protein